MKLTFALVALFPLLSWADSAVLTAAPGSNAYLRANEKMISPSGNVTLVMQGDGNLVVYRSNCIGQPACAVWNSQTAGGGASFMAIQEDGNLVVYRGTPEANGGPAWNSQTPGAKANYFLALQDDENLVVYRGTGPRDNNGAVWSTKTGPIGSGAAAGNDGRIQLGWTVITPCSKVEWRQVYNTTVVTAEQRLYGYAYVNKAELNKAKTDIEQCAVQAVAACGIAALTASPPACAPAFKVQLSQCLSSRNVNQTIVQSVRLSAESSCMW